MAEYLHYEALVKELNENFRNMFDPCVWDDPWVNGYLRCISDVEEFPASDVVEVVRCDDCNMQQTCKFAQYLGADGYCSHGERREK